MKQYKILGVTLCFLISGLVFVVSCSKGDGGTTPPNPCSGVVITVSGTVTNPTIGFSNGSITATATGSSGFTFNINGGTFQSSGNFTGLAAGSYTIIAKTVDRCSGSATFTLTGQNPCSGITITVSGGLTNPTSGSANNGSITASASGGASPYMFSLNGGTFQSSNIFNNLGAGNFTITARDANNCTGSAVFTLTAPNPCAGVTITINSNTTPQVPCVTPNGSITINATGGTGPYTFSLNGGTFQASNIFNNLIAGNYTLAAKDVNSCNGSGNATVATATAGPLFAAVKNLIQANCATSGCHAGTQSPDFRVDCNIVNNRFLIQQRAVFGNPSPMPQSGLLPASERQKITDWINAGGQFNN